MTDLLASARGEPKCIAVLICNEIIEDKLTNNKTLVGLFNSIATPVLPAVHPRMFVMASFAEGSGQWPFRLIVQTPDGHEMLRFEGEMILSNYDAVVDLVFDLRGIPLSQEGAYLIDVLVGEKMVNSRRFTVILWKGEQK